MKLHQHFVYNFLGIFLTVLILSAIVSYTAIKEGNTELHVQELKTHLEILKTHINHEKDLDTYAQMTKSQTGLRLTLIDDDGVVIAESNHDKKTMDNHGERPEVLLARAEGSGYSVRHSKTLDVDFLYVASRAFWQDKPIFARLSMELSSINERFLDVWLKISAVLFVTLAIGLYVFYKMSQRIETEIVKITDTLDAISNKDYKANVDASFAYEFKQIDKHITKLAKRLEKREKQKRKYNAKIRFISKQRSDVISAISHEFKNPIASVIGYAQTLLEDPHTKEEIRERFLEKIVKNSQKISVMIDRLALATKFENGDLSPQPTEFDLFNLTSDLISTFKDKYPQRHIYLVGENLKVTADKTMIELVLSNLIDNAIKYSEDDVNVTIDEGYLHVSDRGIGIAPEEIDKVTNKFYRSNTHTWDNSIGLGLALVKYILSLHNSQLIIKSELAQGSTFSFKL